MFWTTKIRNQTGKRAEDMALAFLKSQGLSLRSRNYAFKGGELDLIMEDRDTLIFIEVRFRKNNHYGSPEETVDFRKQQRLNRAAAHFLQNHNLTDKQPCRFDIITIQPDANRDTEHSVNWIRNAFGP